MKCLTKLEAAIELYLENGLCSLGDFNISKVNEVTTEIIGFSEYLHLENITKKIAISELTEIKKRFEFFISETPALAAVLKSQILQFSLVYNDGRAGLGFCTEKNGEIFWLHPLFYP